MGFRSWRRAVRRRLSGASADAKKGCARRRGRDFGHLSLSPGIHSFENVGIKRTRGGLAMEKKRSGAAPMRPSISADRAGRLYKLLVALGEEPQDRENLAKRLKVGVRTFFRDVDLLRECGAP